MILPSTGARRPSGFDDLGARRALSDRPLPLLLAAVAFLSVLALDGWFASVALVRHWQKGMGATLTVQVPRPGAAAAQGNGTLLALLALLAATPGMASAHALSERKISDLLEPWIGKRTERLASAVPAVIAVRPIKATESQKALSHRLSTTAPGTLLQDYSVWAPRLSMLARNLQTCAGGAVVLVDAATAMMAFVIRAELSARRQTNEIVHGLGATNGYIAVRATRLAAAGASLGPLAALPALLVLVQLTRPFGERQAVSDGRPSDALQDAAAGLPLALWYALPCLPLGAAAIGLVMVQATVRHWLRPPP